MFLFYSNKQIIFKDNFSRGTSCKLFMAEIQEKGQQQINLQVKKCLNKDPPLIYGWKAIQDTTQLIWWT